LRNKFVKGLLALTLLLSLMPLSQASAAAPTFIQPADGVITSTFKDSSYYQQFGRHHYGIDIAKSGTVPIVASAPGTVIRSGYSDSFGEVVYLRHNINGKYYVTVYAHMRSGTRTVSLNQTVNQGQVLGYMGSTGDSTGQHLHFQMNPGTTYDKLASVDPMDYIGKTLGEQPIQDSYQVYSRSYDKKAVDLGKFATLEAATTEMNKYNNASIIELATGREIKNTGVVRDIKVYHGTETADGVNYYASFSTITAAENFLDRYQNMAVVDTSTWKQIDHSVSNSFKYGAFNGSNGDRGDYGVKNAAIDYLESNFTNGVVVDKTYSYPKVVWESNPDLPNKYYVTDGTVEARYSIYTAAVYAKNSRPNSTLTIE
jgi:Peptidase family M23